MTCIYAGYDKLSAVADSKSFMFLTFGLANCIAIFAREGGNAALAHYNTLHACSFQSDAYGGSCFNNTSLCNFRNWMISMRHFKKPAFKIVLGCVWYNTANLESQKISGVSYQNARDFSRHNLILALRTVFEVEPVAATPRTSKGVAFVGENVYVEGIAGYCNAWDSTGKDAGDDIPYNDLR